MPDMSRSVVHMAKSPMAAVLTTWCGRAQARESGAVMDIVAELQKILGARVRAVVAYAHDNPIVVAGAWTCPACTHKMREQARNLASMLDGVPVEAPPPMGCGDNGCPARWPGGVGTNGGCRCSPPELRQACARWRKYALALEAGRVPPGAGGSP